MWVLSSAYLRLCLGVEEDGSLTLSKLVESSIVTLLHLLALGPVFLFVAATIQSSMRQLLHTPRSQPGAGKGEEKRGKRAVGREGGAGEAGREEETCHGSATSRQRPTT